MQGRLVRLVAVGNQAAQQIDDEVGDAAMARMFDLGDVLELVNDALGDGTLAQQQFVCPAHQAILHGGLEFGDELNVEIVQELMPEEGAGLIREIGYDHLPLGSFDTRIPVEEQTTDPEFTEVLTEFTHSTEAFDEADPDFNNAYGLLHVTQEQDQLKRLTWEIHWLSAEGVEENFERVFFLHQDSMYWEQYGRKDFSWLRQDAGNEGE